ncbi:hypothetical protein HP548_25285 [Paenibacillus taichungensis]|uniref:Uncharacterized protein n=1 Tax=Paenibacillus taichungensis TaxID=484184 RepID=A0ABX2MTP9_9BACL|nr:MULTISPECIES: hypothetical protein [Paenibacillus]NUU57400.1 hypothetical protein [Paenibacillus taichungensis]PIH56775.1 hypothetical protein CS562_24240 [Paenibacillus sp. LK1]
MGLFEWIFNNLYIVAVIAFALFSFLGKAAKSADPNKKRPNNGMPTFGGSGDSDRNDRSRGNTAPQQSSGPSDPRYDEQYDERYDERYDDDQYDDRYDQTYSQPATISARPVNDDFGGQGSLGGMENSLEEQMKVMEQRQREIRERLDRISTANTPVVSDSSWDEVSSSESGSPQLRREDIRTGVLWAEVLGSPRSKQPFGTRGKL